MGNSMGGRRTAKVMKIDGETFKLKTPKRVWDVIKDHPGHILLDSEAVKHFGIRAKPLEPNQELKPRKMYFLVELPRLPVASTPMEEENRVPRRVRSVGIQMSARERLECLMLSRRTSSDLSLARQRGDEGGGQKGAMRVKLRISRGEMARLVAESKDEKEVAEKIMKMYMGSGGEEEIKDNGEDNVLLKSASLGGNGQGMNVSRPPRRKHVRFDPVEDGGEIQAFV